MSGTKDATQHVEVAAPPSAVYSALTTAAGLTGWWTTDAEVGTSPGESITLRWSATDFTVMRIDLLRPERKVEWTCIAQHDTNLPDPVEWVGTRILFDISRSASGTTLTCAHVGLMDLECGEICNLGWMRFLDQRLKPLVEGAFGRPWIAVRGT